MGAMKFRPRWYSLPNLVLLLPSVGLIVLPFVVRFQGRLWGVVLGVVLSAFWVMTVHGSTVEVTPGGCPGLRAVFSADGRAAGTDPCDALG